MHWYFLDFEIYNERGVIEGWSNATVESDDNPRDVLVMTRKQVMNDAGLNDINRVRVRAFNKI
jgi:hypothetical protein